MNVFIITTIFILVEPVAMSNEIALIAESYDTHRSLLHKPLYDVTWEWNQLDPRANLSKHSAEVIRNED